MRFERDKEEDFTALRRQELDRLSALAVAGLKLRRIHAESKPSNQQTKSEDSSERKYSYKTRNILHFAPLKSRSKYPHNLVLPSRGEVHWGVSSGKSRLTSCGREEDGRLLCIESRIVGSDFDVSRDGGNFAVDETEDESEKSWFRNLNAQQNFVLKR